jgi:hypothetical protein
VVRLPIREDVSENSSQFPRSDAMCFLCEEPFRTIFIALAAVGAVSLIRAGHKVIRRVFAKSAEIAS